MSLGLAAVFGFQPDYCAKFFDGHKFASSCLIFQTAASEAASAARHGYMYRRNLGSAKK